MKRGFTITLTGMLAAGLLAAPGAVAKDGDVIKTGGCSGRSDWKLKLSPENGKIEVDFEVDQNRVGDRWRVTLKHDGDRIFRDVRETRGPSGSFEVHQVEPNRAGDDFFVGKALNLSTEEECRGAGTF